MTKELDINEKKVLKAKLLSDLAFFTRFFFKEIYGEKFVLNWHHEILFNGLTDVKKRILDILIENLPPRHSKTEVIVMFVAWSIAINPKSAFIIVSHSDTLATDTSTRIRDIISHPIYQELFDVDLKKDVNSKGLWRTIQGGGIRSTSLGGEITGFGAGHLQDEFDFYGAIIIDDPDKIKNIGLKDETKASELFDSTIQNRRNGVYTPIIVIQQRVSINDLTGHIVSGKSKLGEFKKLKSKHISLPVENKDGEPLWKLRMDEKRILAEKNNPETGWLFNAQFLQEPDNLANSYFNKTDMLFFAPEELKEKETVFSFIDTADEGTDYYSQVFCALQGNYIYVFDVIYNQFRLGENEKLAAYKLNNIKANYCVVETNKEGSYFYKNLKQNVNCKVIPIFNHANKITRIIQYADFINDRYKFLKKEFQSIEYQKFFESLCSFSAVEKNKNDDAPDSLAGSAKFAVNFLKIT